MLSDKEWYQLKKTQLEIMDFVHDVCVNNGIKYFLYAGTCIGAVRHKGYIPWDYDIDICLLREDYDKLENIMKELKNDEYKYINYKLDRDYFRPHAIVVKNDTEVYTQFDVINRKLNYNHGIYIDVMPLDYTDGIEKDFKTIKKLNRIKKIIKLKKGYHYSTNEPLLKSLLRSFIRILLLPISLNYLNSLCDRLMRKSSQEGIKYVTDYTSKYSHEKSIWPADVFSEAILHEFEGRFYYIPKEFDRYLSIMYGDYMKIPDSNKIANQKKVFAYIRC